MPLTKLCEETKRLMITQLIELGEAQRKIYEQFSEQVKRSDLTLLKAYKHHQRELELLIKYQKEHNS